MKKKQRISCMYLAFLLTGACTIFMFVTGSQLWAQEKGSFLANKHMAKGLQCSACHKENPPQKSVPQEVCLKCHGSAEKLAADTMDKTPNPHESHLGDVVCGECHHAHKKSESKCAQCHDFNMQVP